MLEYSMTELATEAGAMEAQGSSGSNDLFLDQMQVSLESEQLPLRIVIP